MGSRPLDSSHERESGGGEGRIIYNGGEMEMGDSAASGEKDGKLIG